MTQTSLTDLAKKLAGPGQASTEEKPKKRGKSQSRHGKKSSPSKMEMDAERQ
jgi:hypothetical protein